MQSVHGLTTRTQGQTGCITDLTLTETQDVFIRLGLAEGKEGFYPVRIQIERKNADGYAELTSLDVLDSFNTKKTKVSVAPDKSDGRLSTPLNRKLGLPISVAKLLEIAQHAHPSILSNDVSKKLGMEYLGADEGMRYSKKDTVSDGGIARDRTKDAEGFGEKVSRKMQDSMLPERKMEERLGITDKNKSFCKRKGA